MMPNIIACAVLLAFGVAIGIPLYRNSQYRPPSASPPLKVTDAEFDQALAAYAHHVEAGMFPHTAPVKA